MLFAVLVLGHGAGADMRHASMTSIATELARRRIAVLRFNFPFMEGAKRPVDSRAVSTATIAAAVAQARRSEAGAAAVSRRPFVRRPHGIARDTRSRSRQCSGSRLLFVSAASGGTAGDQHEPITSIRSTCRCCFFPERATRWRSADLLDGVIARLGARAELVWLETADHGYKVLKRSRARGDSVFEELADAAARFVNRLC